MRELREACAQIRRWSEEHGRHMAVCVNVSAMQLASGQLVEDVLEAITLHGGVNPAALELELTESTLMANVEESVKALERLSEVGVRVAVDDFGTGYSSLSYLQTLPLRTLKLDRFFHTATVRPKTRIIVQSIVQLGRALGLSVVAEGIETVEQQDAVITMVCDLLQGYFLGRPCDLQATNNLLQKSTTACLTS